MLLPVAEYRPDVANTNSAFSNEIANVLPADGSYIPMPQLVVFTDSLSVKPLSGFFAKQLDGSVKIIVGSAAKLWALNSSTLAWDDISQAATTYSASDDEPWAFAQFGDYVVAVNANDDPQVFQLGTSTEFADLGGSPPRARLVQAVGPFLMLGNLTSNQNRVQWSALEDITGWTAGTDNSDYQDFPEGGQVVGITRSKDPLILMQKGVYRGIFMPGSREIFAFDKLLVELGSVSPRSVAANAEMAFFNDAGGFYQAGYDGSLVRIGFEKVDKTIRSAVTASEMAKIQAIIDPVSPRAYFFANDGTSAQFNVIYVYDWAVKRWTPIRQDTVCPMIAATPGYTLDGIGAIYSDLDALPFSLDSAFWQAGNPQLAAFQSDGSGGYKLGFFTGSAMAATIVSPETGDPNTVLLVKGVFPVCDASDQSQVSVTIASRFRLSDAHTNIGPSGLSGNTGWARKKSRARFHKFKVNLAAGADWNHVKGVEVSAMPVGTR